MEKRYAIINLPEKATVQHLHAAVRELAEAEGWNAKIKTARVIPAHDGFERQLYMILEKR